MFCGNCGAENTDGATFCAHCGTSLTEDQETRVQTPEQTQAQGGEQTQTPQHAQDQTSVQTPEQTQAQASAPTSQQAAAPAGGSFGPYQVLGELGRGAMARVWRAFDPNLEREVAIKEPLFDQNLSQDVLDEMGRRFVKEGRAAAKLDHSNIVTIYAADVYDGRPAIVMELVEGATLGEILENGPLTPSETLSVLDQLLDAVGYAHKKGVVHRDIKPDNIFVSNEGRVKLADFGIARVDGGREARSTMVGTVLGTPGYMSPEQARGNPVDGRSDLFSVATVGYEMLMGYNPFNPDGADSTTLLYRIVHENVPELPPGASAGLPADLRPAIGAALSKDPNYRPQTAAEFKAMLHGNAAAIPVQNTAALASKVEQSNSGLPKWLPFVAVGVLGLGIMAGMFFSAGNSGSATGGNTAVIPTATSAAIETTASADEQATNASSASASSQEEPEKEPEPVGATPPYFGDSATVSSITAEDTIDPYGATSAIDGDPATAWNTSGKDNPSAAGEWIEIGANELQHVEGVRILAGFCKDEKTWEKNRRPCDITLMFSDGTKQSAHLDNVYNSYQDIKLDKAVDTYYVRISIDSSYEPTYDGRRYDDCAISEIEVY